MTRIEELLEKRDVLSEMAAVMYGDLYVADENFWKSSIQRDLFKVEEELFDLGYEEEATPEQEMAAQILFDAFKYNGIIPNDEWYNENEEEDEDFLS